MTWGLELDGLWGPFQPTLFYDSLVIAVSGLCLLFSSCIPGPMAMRSDMGDSDDTEHPTPLAPPQKKKIRYMR